MARSQKARGVDGGCGLAHASPCQPPPPAAPFGLGLEHDRPFALIGQGEPLSLLTPVITLAAHVVSLPAHVVSLLAHVVQHGPEIADPLFESREARTFASRRAVSPSVAPRSPVPFPVSLSSVRG